MINLSYFQALYNDLFWKEKPNCLSIGELQSENTCPGFNIQIYDGHYTYNTKEIPCKIRVVSEICGDLKKLARKELGIIKCLTGEPNIAKCFGVYFNESKYILVTKRYARDIQDIRHFDTQTKIQILIEIMKGTLVIHQKLLSYHGNISPSSIYITKNNRVKIGSFFNSGEISLFMQNFSKLKETIDVIDVKYMSPELRLQYDCIRSGYTLKPFDCCKSDNYSIGLVFLCMITGVVHEINDFGVDPELCDGLEVNKTHHLTEIHEPLYSTFIKSTTELEQSIAHIKNQLSDTDKLSCSKILKSLLDVYYDDRANLQDVLNTALNISKQPMMIDIKMINNFEVKIMP